VKNNKVLQNPPKIIIYILFPNHVFSKVLKFIIVKKYYNNSVSLIEVILARVAVEAEGLRFKARGPQVFLRTLPLSEMLQLATINVRLKIWWRMEQ
jgi:hypothetical protein